MDLERVAAAIRPRSYPEAVDLGFHMVRAWWKPLYGTALVPVAVVVLAGAVGFYRSPWVTVLAVWCLKPVYDRGLLFVLSRALFGSTPSVRAALAALPRELRAGGLTGWIVERFDPTRSLRLPVRQLEGLRGSARRARLQVLTRGVSEHAGWLTLICALLELALAVSLVAFLAALLPGAWLEDRVDLTGDIPQLALSLRWALAACWVVAAVAIEPFYVAAGFCLYLTRRTRLEAWDVEVAFRRTTQRLRAARKSGPLRAAAAGTLLLGLLVGNALLAAEPPRTLVEDASEVAEDRAPDPADVATRQAVAEILAAPEFGGVRHESSWRLRPLADADEGGTPILFGSLARTLAAGIERVLWVAAVIAAVSLLVYAALRHARGPVGDAAADDEEASAAAPFGLDIREESLPADVAAVARGLLADGDVPAALRLLYRGALARLGSRYELTIRDGATEGDCVRLAVRHIPALPAGYFRELTHAWQRAAYGHNPPASDTAARLVRDWAEHFA